MENQLEKHNLEIREKINELLLKAKVMKVVRPFGEHTERQFLVTIYQENTEFLACMQMLAEISKWFNVQPI